jgi:hypothetical protein
LSQRSALGWTSPRTTWAGSFVEARQSILEEAFAPLAHDLAARIQASRNLIVVQALGGHQDHLGPNHLEIWQRVSNCTPVQLGSLDGRQFNVERTLPRHIATFNAGSPDSVMQGISLQLYYVNVFKKKPTGKAVQKQSENAPMTASMLACTIQTCSIRSCPKPMI